jgi:hypothetical protein
MPGARGTEKYEMHVACSTHFSLSLLLQYLKLNKHLLPYSATFDFSPRREIISFCLVI